MPPTRTSTRSRRPAAVSEGEVVREIPLGDVAPDPHNPRKEITEDDSWSEFVASIKSVGVLQPVIVRPGEDGFVLVMGERRWRGAKAAGLKTVPAIVRAVEPDAAEERMLIENLQRSDLTALEEAQGYARLLERGVRQKDIATRLGKSPGHVSKRLALLKLPDEAKALVTARRLPVGDAAEIASKLADDPERAKEAARNVAERGWDVGEAITIEKRRASEAKARADALERLKEAKVKVIAWPKGGFYQRPEKPLGKAYGEVAVPVKEHAGLKCHAVAVADDGAEVPVCTKPANHAPAKAGGDGKAGSLSEDEKAARAATRLENKAKAEAAALRLEKVTAMVRRRLAAQDVLDILVARWLDGLGSMGVDSGALKRACAILEVEPDDMPARWSGGGTYRDWKAPLERLLDNEGARGDAVAVGFALVAGHIEEAVARGVVLHEGSRGGAAAYLTYLEQKGHELAPVERQLVADLVAGKAPEEAGDPAPRDACPACGGDGTVPGRPEEACEPCQGTGVLQAGDEYVGDQESPLVAQADEEVLTGVAPR